MLHRDAMTSLVGIWKMMVVARELEERCTTFEQYLATQVLQFRGNMFKSLTTVSERVCREEGSEGCYNTILPSNPPLLHPTTGHSNDTCSQTGVPRK